MKKPPDGIEMSTAGMLMDSSEGPAIGSNPKATTSGRIAIPASIDAQRAANMTRSDDASPCARCLWTYLHG